MERQQAKHLWDWSAEEEGENQCPRPLPYPAGTELLKSEEKMDLHHQKSQTSASLQNKTTHLPQEQTPNPIAA